MKLKNIINKLFNNSEPLSNSREQKIKEKELELTRRLEKPGLDDEDNVNEALILKETKTKKTVKPSYELANINIIKDEESKNLIPFINKIKESKGINIPIGTCEEETIIENINTMPNLLIGGTVMSGKTSFINTIIASILLTKTPYETKIAIFDSKRIDYSIYNNIPHLICPVITDIKKLNTALYSICSLIENRRNKLIETHTKNIDAYNMIVDESKKEYSLILIIDDFSTLNVSEEINASINYITTYGWNVNVFVILAANHPSAKVIPTISKSNFPARLSFRVASSQSSRIIIDDNGAEKLKAFGEALYISRKRSGITKIEVPYITDNDIERIIKSSISQRQTLYDENFDIQDTTDSALSSDLEYQDPIYNDVVEFAVQSGKISASLIQRRFRIGYYRAAQLIDLLELRGIIGKQNGSKPREVLVKLEDDN